MAKTKKSSKTELVLFRNSESSTFKDCRQSWWWAYVEQRVAKQKRTPLEFGTLVHRALELWYIPGKKRGLHPAKGFAKAYDEYLRDGNDEIIIKTGKDRDGVEGTRVDALDLARDMLNGYVEYWGKDSHLEILAPEQNFQVDVHHTKSGKYLFTAVGQIDAVARDLRTNYIIFLEHKTGATLSPFGAPEALDEQSGMYWTYGPAWLESTGVLRSGELPDALVFNRLKKTMGDTRPKNEEGHSLNKDGSVSKVQPSPRFARSPVYRTEIDRQRIMTRTKQVAREMRLVREGKLAAYKNPGRHCGYCQFREVCEVHETGGDYKEMFKAMYTHWDPYEDHTNMDLSEPE